MQRCWLQAARALLLWEIPTAALQVLSVGCRFHSQQQDLVSVSQTPPEMGLQLKGTAWICCLRRETLLSCGVIPALHGPSSRGSGSSSCPLGWLPALHWQRVLGANCRDREGKLLLWASINLSWHLPAAQGEAFGNLRPQCHLLPSLSVTPLCLEPSLGISFPPNGLQGRSCSSPWNCSQLPLVLRAVELTSGPFAPFVPQPKETSWNSR